MTAVLGPTNTGKTHLAIERMLSYPSGMIGLPLRLLAREVYGRVIERVGSDSVALITGEERITPDNPRFFVCTVEAMPPADVDFLAIDEVQLAGDLERGHIFLDRILHMRGAHQTMLLGASTAKNVLEALLPDASFVTRPRLSQLRYAGQKKITRLPPRSAIVAFSADEVYAIAELIRRQRGAAAVVLGSLSPRTRNAQVELYQSGDVDFLVATDAIGMGLNLDLDHVAFAGDSKFDGTHFRRLVPAEIAQIAGRAGRHERDGTFGVTSSVEPFNQTVVERLEGHDFEPQKIFQWRNSDLNFDSTESLLSSLDAPPPSEFLVKTPQAVDHRALLSLRSTPQVRDKITSPTDVRRLWDVCRIPDYRRIAPADHIDLLRTIFLDLTTSGAIDENWLVEQVDRCDNPEGEIDALSNRLSHIRTWTFVSHRPDWLTDYSHWRSRTREVENKLSDALHNKLIQRFVDRRTSVLTKRLRARSDMDAEILDSGDVIVEGHLVGTLTGFCFEMDESARGVDAKTARAAASQVLGGEIQARATRLVEAPDDAIELQPNSDCLLFGGEIVGRLAKSDNPLRPRIALVADDLLAGSDRERVLERLENWFANYAGTLLRPLYALQSPDLSGIEAGIGFRLVENMGVIPRRDILSDVRSLDQAQRSVLRKRGVRFGEFHIYIPVLLRPAAASLIMRLWHIARGDSLSSNHLGVLEASLSGRTSIEADSSIDTSVYRLAGFDVFGDYAIRIDILERFSGMLWTQASDPKPDPESESDSKSESKPDTESDSKPDSRQSGFFVTADMLSILGVGYEALGVILKSLGYECEQTGDGEPSELLWRRSVHQKFGQPKHPKKFKTSQTSKASKASKTSQTSKNPKKSKKDRTPQKIDSPFGVLAGLRDSLRRDERTSS